LNASSYTADLLKKASERPLLDTVAYRSTTCCPWLSQKMPPRL